MDKAQLVALISTHSQKLRALREQMAIGNQEKKRLYVAALVYLLEQKRTQSSAYQEITQLLVTASSFIANAIHQEIAPYILRLHSQPALDQCIILWARMCDGSFTKKQYPNLKQTFQTIKIKQPDRPLSLPLKNYFLQFQKNFTKRHNQKVQFFQDFDDSVLSQSIQNDSQLINVIYLSIMEVKTARKKLSEHLPDEAVNQQITKLKHFLSLKIPSFLSEHERTEFEKQRLWVKHYLQSREEKRRTPNMSLNQHFVQQGEQESLGIVDNNPKSRIFKKTNNRQIFQDSLDLSQKNQSKKFKVGQPHPLNQSSPTSVKMLDPRYNQHPISSRNSSLEIHNGYRSQPFEQYQHVEECKEEVGEEELIIHKIKPGEIQPIRAKPLQDFSVTDNYFKKGQEVLSPRGVQSQTFQKWSRANITPNKHSHCKLSKFTSEKKARKELAPRDQLSVTQPHVILPYLECFDYQNDYARFRINCFQNTFSLFSSELFNINCTLEKEAHSKLRLELTFTNNIHLPLELEILYKVPQCYAIEKRTKIAKRFQLHTHLKHVFCLSVQQFPLQPCLLSLKGRSSDNEYLSQGQVPFPLTLLSFIEYLCVSEQEWIKEWTTIKDNHNLYFFAKHIEIDRHIVGDDIEGLLRDLFVRVTAIQGYSVQDYGCVCFYPGMQNLRFLVHLSVRVDNIVSLQASSCRAVTKDEREFIEYCLNLWMMLLGKPYI